ncbi:MAG: ABC transporter permease [Eubacteriales bacterium]
MEIWENISLAIAGLKANKMRTMLTMLGIIIGIASVIGIMTVGTSMTNSVTSSLQGMGANNVTVSLQQKSQDKKTNAFGIPANSGSTMFGGRNLSSNNSTTIQPEQSDYITDVMISNLREGYGDQIEHISLTESVGTGKVQDGHLYANVSLMGTNDEYNAVSDITMMSGRYINQKDVLGTKDVAVVSDKMATNIFGTQDPLGKQIKVYLGKEIYTFTIIGEYKFQKSSLIPTTASDQDLSTSLYIPVSTAKRLDGSGSGYQYFTIQTKAGVNSDVFMPQVNSFFNKYYERNQNFTVTSSTMESLVSQVNTMLNTLSLAISLIAAISLLVGGIGVMNILLVSITERTKEIGTRKALGATNGSIRIQFITESVIICHIGGAIGIAAGIGLGMLGVSLLGYEASASVSSIFLALGFSMLIGIFFGYYPANKAAKMDPIEALRYE